MGNQICQTPILQQTYFRSKSKSQNFRHQHKQIQLTQSKSNHSFKSPIKPLTQLNLTENQLSQDKSEPIQHLTESRQFSQQTPTTQFSKTNFNHFNSNNSKKLSKIDHSQTYLKHIKSQKQEGNINFQPISVPFSVIVLLLSKTLINLIQKDHPKFFIKYSDDQTKFKLYKSGCYGLIFNNNFAIFLNSGYFYQGNFILKQNGQFLPSIKGTFIKQSGKYVGQFKDGKPHGKGKYYEFNKSLNLLTFKLNQPLKTSRSQKSVDQIQNKSISEIVYEGEWVDGLLLKGRIQNDFFKYQGSIQNCKPQGYGKLIFKKTKITYKGEFKNGLFDGKMCIYQTPKYIYQGNFLQGKKQGYGVLVKKTVNVNDINSKIKYLPQQRYQGRWVNDEFINQQFIEFKKS